jgi:hypothetical protein
MINIQLYKEQIKLYNSNEYQEYSSCREQSKYTEPPRGRGDAGRGGGLMAAIYAIEPYLQITFLYTVQ